MCEGYDTVLEHPYRRYLLYCLCRYSEPVKLPDIASQIAIWTADPTSRVEFLQERFWIYDELYFDHLPDLTERGAVHYNQEDDMVTFGPKKQHVLDVVEADFETEFRELMESEDTRLYDWS